MYLDRLMVACFELLLLHLSIGMSQRHMPHMSPAQPPSSHAQRWMIFTVILVVLLSGTFGAVYFLTQQRRQSSRAAADFPPPIPSATTEPTIEAATITATADTHPSVSPPRSQRLLQVFDYGWYQVGYDNERRAGAWGRYELDGPIRNSHAQPPRPRSFRTESRSTAQVHHKDYSNPSNLFERGHIVPGYALWSRHGVEARDATFVMTNVFPQDEDVNGRLWEDLEDDIAGQARGGVVVERGYADRLRHITVIAGPVYGAGTRALPSGIPIPDACFLVIYDVIEAAGTLRARAYLVPNEAKLSGPTSRYAQSIRTIEQATGLDFMPDGAAHVESLELAPAVVEPW